MNAMTEIMIYDVSIDAQRPATQQDVDELQAFVFAVQIKSEPIENHPRPSHGYDFKLACYPNRFRDDGLFVAEKKSIEAYEGITTLEGKPIYSSVPKTKWQLRSQLPHDFAHELVWRWNIICVSGR